MLRLLWSHGWHGKPAARYSARAGVCAWASRRLKRNSRQLCSRPPPPSGWLRFRLWNSAKDLERLIDRANADMRVWRGNVSARLTTGLTSIEEAVADLPPEEARAFLLPMIDELFAALADFMAAYATPLHDRPESAQLMQRLGQIPGPAGRYLRKQIRRIEVLRVEQYNAAVDMYYALLAFRTEIEGQEKAEEFTDARALGDFLRKQIA